MSIYLNIEVSERSRASWGCEEGSYLEVSVEEDGEVRVLDPVSETYTRHHKLTHEELSKARLLAMQVQSGTHYASGGFVFKKNAS